MTTPKRPFRVTVTKQTTLTVWARDESDARKRLSSWHDRDDTVIASARPSVAAWLARARDAAGPWCALFVFLFMAFGPQVSRWFGGDMRLLMIFGLLPATVVAFAWFSARTP